MNREFKINCSLIILYLIILLNERLLYLIPNDGSRTMDAAIILIIVLIFSTKFRGLQLRRDNLSIPIIILLLDFIIGIIISRINGQQFSSSLMYNRCFIYYILYFPLSYIMKNEKNREKIKCFCIRIGALFSILALIQYFLYPKIIILKAMTFNYRLHNLRYFSGFTCVIISMFFILDEIFQCNYRKKRILWIFIYGLEFWYIILVTQTKSLTIAILISTGAVILLQKQYKGIYKITFIIVCLIMMYIFFGEDISSVWYDAINDVSGTGELRKIYWNFVADNIWKSPVFGWGVVGPNYPGVYYNIHIDIGMIGFIFEFGIVGLIWSIFVLGRMLNMIYKIYKINSQKSYKYVSYVSYGIILIPFNCLFNIREYIISFLIINIFLEYDYKECILKVKNINKKG